MKKIIGLTIATSVAAIALSPANAAEGCGRGYHRGPHGHCRANVRPGVAVVAPGLVIGNFYTGRGYWDGHRYWQHRERWHGGWRYR